MGSPLLSKPQGMESPQLPARLSDRVKMSARYICRGSSAFSPILKAVKGEVGQEEPRVEPQLGAGLDREQHGDPERAVRELRAVAGKEPRGVEVREDRAVDVQREEEQGEGDEGRRAADRKHQASDEERGDEGHRRPQPLREEVPGTR